MKNMKWQSDIDDENSIDVDKINFIYENAVDYLKELENGMQTINTRATLLLGYLIASVAVFAVNFAVKTENQFIEFFSAITVIEYIFIIFYTTHTLLMPKLGCSVKNEPSNLLTKNVIKYDLKMLKFFECENMQGRININHKRQETTIKHLKYAIYGTFYLPAINFCVLFFLYYLV